MNNNSFDILIIGGGINGCGIAMNWQQGAIQYVLLKKTTLPQLLPHGQQSDSWWFALSGTL